MYSQSANDDLVLIAFEKNSTLEKKFSINDFDDEFNYEKAILEAKEGNHYALAQLGKFYYESDKPRALLYFDAAIKKDNILQYNSSNNLIYSVASNLPADEPKKIEYYFLGLQKRLLFQYSFNPQRRLNSEYDQYNPVYYVDEKASVAAISFLLHHVNKKSHFVDLMLIILNNIQTDNQQHGIGVALKSAGYSPAFTPGETSRYELIYFNKAVEEFFSLIEKYPQSFQNVICRLSQDELDKVIKYHPKYKYQGWGNERSIFKKYFSEYQNRIAEEICMYQILNPDSDIEAAKDYIFKLHMYHDDYRNGIDALVNDKLQKYMQEGEKIDKEMKVVLDAAEESAQHMLSDLQITITKKIQALEGKLGIEIIETDDITKPVEKETKKQRILQIQLDAFRQVELKLIELSSNPPPPFDPLSLEISSMPPSYSDKQIQSHFEKVQIIAACIKMQNTTVSKQFAKLNREPIEWWKGVRLFLASLPMLVLPVMLYSKRYLHTYQFWNIQKIALKSKEAKIFSENNLFNTVVKHVEEKKRAIKKIDETKK